MSVYRSVVSLASREAGSSETLSEKISYHQQWPIPGTWTGGAVDALRVKPDYKDGEAWKWSCDPQRELPRRAVSRAEQNETRSAAGFRDDPILQECLM